MPKDKTKPAKEKKPRSAYILYSNAVRQEVIAENPQHAKKMSEITKIIGARWKSLSADEKKEYLDQAAEERAAFEEKKKGEA